MNFPEPVITDKPPIIPPNTRKPRKEKGPKERQAELDKKKEEFLKKGGIIERVDSGASGTDPRRGHPTGYNPYPVGENT